MAKDPRLLNIYLKIHNKRSLTMDDLQYLAIYSPECFEKTCKNVVYNFPKAKPIMEPTQDSTPVTPPPAEETLTSQPQVQDILISEQQKIDRVLENLRQLETQDMPQTTVNAKEVKDLLGNLFMELLFPHNDKQSTLPMPNGEPAGSFDFKV